MVWKSNFLIDGKPFTYDRFMLEEDYFGSWNPFFPNAYFKDPRDAFRVGFFWDKKRFPQHVIFGNFQCLRCGLCCKNHSWCQISPEIISKWKKQNRQDILQYVNEDMKEIQAVSWTGCRFCRRINNKPYYGCKVHADKEEIFDCKVYVCSKSLPMANINYKDVDELIQLIGLQEYYALIEKDWNEDFDYSKCEYKTHKKSRVIAKKS